MELNSALDDLDRSFARLAATARMAVESSSVPDTDFYSAELRNNIMRMLSKDRYRIFLIEVKRLAYVLFDGLKLVEAGYKTKAKVDIGRIEDPIVRSAVALVWQEGLANVAPLSKLSYAREAAIVSLVSAFEVYCLQLLTTFFRLHSAAIPQSIGAPFDVVNKAKSPDEIKNWLAAEAAGKKVEGSIEDTLALIARHSDVKLAKKVSVWPEDWKEVVRTSAVRNCIVHAAGKADDKFRERIMRCDPDRSRDLAKSGTVSVGGENVKKSAKSFLTVASSMFYGVVSRARPASVEDVGTSAARSLASHAWELLGANQLGLASSVVQIDRTVKDSTVVDSLQLVRWTILVVNGDVEGLREQILAAVWPSSEEFQLCRSTLLEEWEHVRAGIRMLLKGGICTALDLLHYPFFTIVRQKAAQILLEEIELHRSGKL